MVPPYGRLLEAHALTRWRATATMSDEFHKVCVIGLGYFYRRVLMEKVVVDTCGMWR